jgi:lactate permease
MLLAARFAQQLDPLGHSWLSTFMAALPVLVLFYLLAWRRWLPAQAGAVGALVAAVVAWWVYGMPADLVGWSFTLGVGFGLMPVGWTIANAMLLYNLTVTSGQFRVVRRSVGVLSDDARVQAVLIGFAFGAFLEGAAGSGAPVAICGVILAGLGFDPFRAAVLCLIANTSPVAYGGLSMPLITLAGVTDLPTPTLSVMAAHQLPFLSLLVPVYMVRCMCNWRQTWAVWPVLAVAGGSFALFQYGFATSHLYIPNLFLYPMTDIGAGVFSLIITALFLRIWQPKDTFRFTVTDTSRPLAPPSEKAAGHTEFAPPKDDVPAGGEIPLTTGNIIKAWLPFALMSLFLLLTGLARQAEVGGKPDGVLGPLGVGYVRSNYLLPVPSLHEAVTRPERLQKPGAAEPEKAIFNFCWLTGPGTPVFLAALTTIFVLRMTRAQVLAALAMTFVQMSMTIPTIAFMLGLSYITRYAGMDATLGIAFAETGWLYPFFAAILGWLGVFLTGTDAGSNALFGSLQKITATEVHHSGAFAQSGLTLEQAQILICTANSTGGVMGKMIDAQSIVVATSATNQVGREADIFWAVLRHSIVLAAVVGLITLVQAYCWPFTLLVPGLP